MSRLRIAPIVEGDGEFECVRILLERIWYELLGGEFLQVVQPIRWPRSKLIERDELHKVVELALAKLSFSPSANDPALVLLLIDADTDCPKDLAPRLLEYARGVDSRADVACVLAHVEYETWFAASAESLGRFLDLTAGSPPSASPEEARHGKLWIEERFRGSSRYSETQDQPSMTREMDLAKCRGRSPSFNKLCRDLEQRMRRPAPGS